jgi:hypothetical protein
MSLTDQGYYPAFLVHLTQLYTKNSNPLVVPRAYNCYVSVAHASIPVTWYNVPAGSNQLVFTYLVSTESAPRTFTFTVPAGNYSATELAAVCSWCGVLPGTTKAFNLFSQYQTNTLVFGFYFKIHTELTYFRLVPSALATIMGFTKTPQTVTDPSYPLCVYCQGDQVADLSSVRNVHINTNFKVRQFSSGTDTLDVVPVTECFGSVINYESTFSAQMYDNIIGDLIVSFTDDAGNAINFNGAPWTLTLRFDFRNPDAQQMYIDQAEPLLSSGSENL